MKWVALAIFIALVPLLTAWLRTNPPHAPRLWSLLSFLPFVLGAWNLDVAPFSFSTWSGYVKGWEVTLLDSVAIAIILGTRGRLPKFYLVVPFLLYFLAAFIAIFQARFPDYAFAYPILLARAFLVYVAVARVVSLEGGQHAIIRGLVLGLCVQAAYAVWERAGGALQTGGAMGHQNLLGFVSHAALIPVFAVFLAGRWPRLTLVGVIAGLTVVILTASRATIGFSAAGLTLAFLLSMSLNFTARKAAIGVAGFFVLLGSIPFAQASLERRFGGQEASEIFLGGDAERVAFEKAAANMIADHPMGVGPNHYVFISNTEGYAERAGVFWGTGSRSTSVHNSFLLVQAEMGYPGLITFVALILAALASAIWAGIRYRKREESAMLVGVACAITAMSLHGLFEWMYLVEPAQYLFGMMLGVIAGTKSRLRPTAMARQVRASTPSTTPRHAW